MPARSRLPQKLRLYNILHTAITAAATKEKNIQLINNLKFVNPPIMENSLMSPAPSTPRRYNRYNTITGNDKFASTYMTCLGPPVVKPNASENRIPMSISRLLIFMHCTSVITAIDKTVSSVRFVIAPIHHLALL